MEVSDHVTSREPDKIFHSGVDDGTSGPSKRRKSKEVLQLSNECSTSDDASSIKEEENIEYLSTEMPQKVRSRPQDRCSLREEIIESDTDNTISNVLPLWVRMRQKPTDKLINKPVVSSRQRRYSGESKWAMGSPQFKSLKKCSSTGDLRKTGNNAMLSSFKRFLPDPSLCQKISNQENVDISDTKVPTPRDRKTLEAQFKLLYCENVKLDRAYSDLQEQVRSETPQIPNSRFSSPRESDLLNENRKLLKEIDQLKENLSNLTNCEQSDLQSVSMLVTPGSLSPPSEKTESYWKDSIKRLSKIKNEEISRLNEQVAYWTDRANSLSLERNVSHDIDETTYTKSSTNFEEKVAELEQSEAQLKCQILNLEDKLVATKSQLALAKTQNDDLGDHCSKLEACLTVIDAEKGMLDDLKQQNGDFRNQLANSEEHIQILVGKLAQLADENAEIELKFANCHKEKDNMSTDSQSDLIKLEMDQLKVELSASNDRCAGLEDVKGCLIEQIKSLEDEIKEFGNLSDRIKELNAKIRKLNSEKAEIVESHDQLQLDKDLNTDMSKKLNQRILNLQDHIETLKSQLEHQKNVIITFDEIQEQLEKVTNEKCSLEATCEQLKNEKHDIKAKLTDQQEKLSESFERANTQLMLETNEMATRQRDLLTDMHKLKVRSQTRGVEAVIGKTFISSIKTTMQSYKPLIVDLFETMNAVKDIPTLDVDDLYEDDTMLDHDAMSKLGGYIKDVDGLSLQQFVDEQNISPRVDGIVPISQLRCQVKDCHEIFTLISRLQSLLEHVLQVYNDASTESPVSNAAQNCDDGGLPIRNMQDEVNKLKNENQRICKLNESLIMKNEKLFNDLDVHKNSIIDNKTSELMNAELQKFKRNSEQLKSELEDSRFTCKMLSEKLMEIQEKALTESEESTIRKEKLENLELAFNETKSVLEKLQLENESYQCKFDEKNDETISLKENYNKENENLLLQLQQLAASKLVLQKELDSKATKTDNLNEVIDSLNLDLKNAQKNHLEEIRRLQNIISTNDSTLLQVKEEYEEAKKKLIDYEGSLHQLENLSKLSNVSTAKNVLDGVEISQERYNILEERNSELKLKLDEVENEKAKLIVECSLEVEKLQKQLTENNDFTKQKDALIENQEKDLEKLQEEMNSSESQVSQIKRLQLELEKSLSENGEMKEEIKVLIQLQKQENVNYSTDEKTFLDENKKLSNQVYELEKKLVELEDTNIKNLEEMEKKNDTLNDLLEEYGKLKISLDQTRKNVTETGVSEISLEKVLPSEAEGTSRDQSLFAKLQELSKINAQLVEENSMISAYLNNLLLTQQASEECGTSALNISASNLSELPIEENNNTTRIKESRDTGTLASIECLQCKALLTEVECLRERLKFENDLNRMEQHDLVKTGNNICISEQSIRLTDDINTQQVPRYIPIRRNLGSSMENLINFEHDLPSVKSSDSFGNLSTTESNVIELGPDKHQSLSKLAEENARLIETINQLNAQLLSNTPSEGHSDYVTNLRTKNSRLHNLLEKRKSDNMSNKDAQNTSYASSIDMQSDTESDPEAERKFYEIELAKKLEILQLEHQEMKCLVVAHKSKLEYMENTNQDLSLENGRLKDVMRSLKTIKLPFNPILNNALRKLNLQITSLSRTAPAVFDENKEFTSTQDLTLSGSITEKETLPFDDVIEILCNEIAEEKNEKSRNVEKLTTELEETKVKLSMLEVQNEEVSQESVRLNESLQATMEIINNKESDVATLQILLAENKDEFREVKLRKENEMKHLETEVNKLEQDIETKTQEIEALQSEKLYTDKLEQQLLSTKSEMAMITEEKKVMEIRNTKLLNKTLQLEASESLTRNEIEVKNKEFEKESQEKQTLIQEYKILLDQKENKLKEHAAQNADLEKTTMIQQQEIKNFMITIDDMSIGSCELMNNLHQKDKDIANLNNKISNKHEEFEVLSSRVQELTQTKEALKSTMESADDMILEREKVYKEEVEELKQGLNKTLSQSMTMQKSNEELLNDIASLEQQNQELSDEIKVFRSKESDVALDIEEMEMERELINTSLHNAREDADDLLQKNEELSSINKELEQDMIHLESTIKTLNHQILEARKDCDQIEIVASERLIDNEELRKTCAELEGIVKINSKNKVSALAGTGVFDAEYEKEVKMLRLENDLQLALQELEQTKSYLEQLKIEKENLKKEVIETGDHQLIAFSSERSCLDEEILPQRGVTNFENCDISTSEANDLRRKILYLEDQISEMRHQVPKLELGSIADESERSHLNLLTENKFLKQNMEELKASLCLTTERLVPKLELGSVSEETGRVEDLKEENGVLRKKILDLKETIVEMTDRLVPKLDLGSICEESKNVELLGAVDDDTCRDVEECDEDTETEIVTRTTLQNQLKCSEENSAKLIIQVQEIEEENENLKSNMEELAKKNENLQKEFFETIHEDFQTQMDELNELNSSLKGELSERVDELNSKQKQLQQISAAETQWRKRYQEVQSMAEELRVQLQRAEVDNQDLQCRLIDLDEECQKMAKEDYQAQATNHIEYTDNAMMEIKVESCAQTLSWTALVQLINEENKYKKKPFVFLQNELEENDVLQSSVKLHSELIAQIPDLTIEEQSDHVDNDTNDLSDAKESSSSSSSSSAQFETEDGVSKLANDDITSYQKTIEILKQENKELLDGSAPAMTQEDRESLEREVSALRGQVALLERNNRIFSDRERTDLKKDLTASNKRCNNYYSQLLVLKRSLEFEEVNKLKTQVATLQKQIEDLQDQIDNRSDESSASDSNSDNDVNTKSKKYAHLLELEEEAEELKQKLQEKDECVKDRDTTIEQIQNQLDIVKKQHENKVKEMEKSNAYKEKELNDEIKDLSRQIEDNKDIIKLKQSNFEKKCEQLGGCETEVEHLKRDVQRKENEIKRLNWEIESLHKENKALRERINNLKIVLSNTSDPNLLNFPLSPISSIRSNSSPCLQNSKLKSPSSQMSSPEGSEVKERHDLGNLAIELNTSTDGVSGGRSRSASVDREGRPRSSLRAGIMEAQQTVNDMGDVLDTPRTPLRGRSPVTKQAINVVDGSNVKHDEMITEKTPNTNKTRLDQKREESLSPIRKNKMIDPNLNADGIEPTNTSASECPEIQKVNVKVESKSESSTTDSSSDKNSRKKSKSSQSSAPNESYLQPLKKPTTSSRKKKKSLQPKRSKKERPKPSVKASQTSENSLLSGDEQNPIVPSKTYSSSGVISSQSELDNKNITASKQSNDRAHLIDEIAKARAEARKWFREVEKADKDKAILDDRMKKMENELRRLKEIKNKELIPNQPIVENQSRDVEVLRAQAEAANRKAEEAREKSTLLRAHLMDKEEVVNLNKKLTKSMEEMKGKILSKENNMSSDSADKKSPTNSELQEIKDRFEYIANSFASLVLKKHNSELILGTTQAKVSELKLKCLERDQLLAKLVVKLKKQKHNKPSNVVESNDESVTSSKNLDEILSEAHHVVQSGFASHDGSYNDLLKSKRKSNSRNDENIEFLGPMRPPSSLLRSLSEKSPKPQSTNTTHRVYVAKKDYTPLCISAEVSPRTSVTHSLLPDLALMTGDTVVAIGKPDSRDDGKLYQLAEVRGKIGFVPYSHLVAAEQMEGIQSYVLERGRAKRTKSVSSSPTNISNLYKKLADAQLAVADRLDRATWAKPPCTDVTNRDVTKPNYSVSSLEYKTPTRYGDNHSSRFQNENKIPNSSENSLANSGTSLSSGVRSAVSKIEINSEKVAGRKDDLKKTPSNIRHFDSSNCSLSPLHYHDNDVIRTSTPISDKALDPSRPRRSSSLPPRRRSSTPSNRSDRSTPSQFFTSSFSKVDQPLRHRTKRNNPSGPTAKLGIPEPPSFLVIEKTMGQKSMIISWTPPVLDMISRSNNIPVIAYEISIDQQRKVQIAGAYTNKAILGDLDLRKTFTIQLRTVSSLGTLSIPADIIFTPNICSNPSESTFDSFRQESPPIIKNLSSKKRNHTILPRNATVLYDYDPVVDSPYKTHEHELKLKQGEAVEITGDVRPDGFCKAKVEKKSGFVPISFLLPDEHDSYSDSTEQLAKPKLFLS